MAIKVKPISRPRPGLETNKVRQERGQVLVFALVLVTVFLLLTGGLLTYSSMEYRVAKRTSQKAQALSLAEAGLEKAIRELNKNAAYSGENDLVLGEGVIDVEVRDGESSLEKIITATGYVPQKTSYKAKKNLRFKAQGAPLAQEITFTYGLQVGEGGLALRNGDQVRGNVYSNGPIKGQNRAQIHVIGEAYSAGDNGLIEDVRVYESMAAHLIHATIGASNGGLRTVKSYDLTNNEIYGQAYYENKNSGNILHQPPAIKESFTPPEKKDFPLTNEQLETLKTAAASGGTISGDYNLPSGTAKLGPKKITGNLNIGTNAILYLTGALYIQGNLEIGNNAQIWLDKDYNGSGYLITDGRIHVDNGAQFRDYYNSNYILMISLASGSEAVDFHKDVWGLYTLFLYVPKGKVHFHSNVQVKNISAYQIELDNNTYINFQNTAQTINFKAGLAATSWSPITGTWQEL